MTSMADRTRQILASAYAVDGVAAVRVWVWNGGVAVAVGRAADASDAYVLARVEAATCHLREGDEPWHFGTLEPGSLAAGLEEGKSLDTHEGASVPRRSLRRLPTAQ
jgi:hypothetical protein